MDGIMNPVIILSSTETGGCIHDFNICSAALYIREHSLQNLYTSSSIVCLPRRYRGGLARPIQSALPQYIGHNGLLSAAQVSSQQCISQVEYVHHIADEVCDGVHQEDYVAHQVGCVTHSVVVIHIHGDERLNQRLQPRKHIYPVSPVTPHNRPSQPLNIRLSSHT